MTKKVKIKSMGIPPKKNQYALRAIFELAKRGKGPTKISEITQAQAIPMRFLEVILNQLKGSGLVESRRGFYGGYLLTHSPDKITVGEIFRFLQRPSKLAYCAVCTSKTQCPFDGTVPSIIYGIRSMMPFSRFMTRPRYRICSIMKKIFGRVDIMVEDLIV